MLIIIREKNEKILIGNDIEVVLLGTYGNASRIGIQAPIHIPIFREELYQQLKKGSKLHKRYFPVSTCLIENTQI